MTSSPLFQSWMLAGLRVSNRIAMAPMSTNRVGDDGHVTERLITYLKQRAIGGCGMIMVESATVDAEFGGTGHNLRLDGDSYLPGLQFLTRELHSFGVAVVAQLWHAGPRARVSGTTPVSSATLDTSGIKAIIESFIAAGDRAARAGFDAIEIHAAHGYLLHHFIDRVTNQRDDAYGRSLEGRYRILREIRSGLGAKHPSLPVIARISFREDDDLHSIARLIEESGFDAVDVRTGFSSMPATDNGNGPPGGYTLSLARTLRPYLTVPLMTGGRILTVEQAEQAIVEDRLDAVVLGRPLLADPHWALKAATGEHIMPCIYDCEPSCYSKFKEGEELRCVYHDRRE